MTHTLISEDTSYRNTVYHKYYTVNTINRGTKLTTHTFHSADTSLRHTTHHTPNSAHT